MRVIFSPQYSPLLGASTLRIIANTLGFGLGTALITSLLALLILFVIRQKQRATLQYHRSRVEPAISLLITLPMASSSITLALGLFLQYRATALYTIFPWALIIAAHVLICLPFTTRAIINSYNQISPELITVASTLGASPWHIFKKIEFPLIKRGFVVGMLFAFAISIGEFGATYFLARGEYGTLSLSISKLMVTRNIQVPTSMATLLIALCIAVFSSIQKLGEFRFKL